VQPIDGSEYPGGMQFSFSLTNPISDTPRISSAWFETPEDQQVGTRVDGDNIKGRSSAYLNVQIPTNGSSTGVLASCSIDARWLLANVYGTGGIWLNDHITYEVNGDVTWQEQIYFPDGDTRNFSSVRLTPDWLFALTPNLGNATDDSWNSLSYMLTELGVDNSTGLIRNWAEAGQTIETTVSAIIADGMSRVGFESNGGLSNTTPDPWPDLGLDDSTSDSILAGTYNLPPAQDDNDNTSDLPWSITVTGKAYNAGSAAYYFALTLLFLHAALAIAHTVWALYTRESSDAWSSLTELVVLALNSPPPTGSTLENTSTSVERYANLKEPVRLRTRKTWSDSKPGSFKYSEDGVHLIVGSKPLSETKDGMVRVGTSH
jgi:hypothetical protein